jgi:hypothetical protein
MPGPENRGEYRETEKNARAFFSELENKMLSESESVLRLIGKNSEKGQELKGNQDRLTLMISELKLVIRKDQSFNEDQQKYLEHNLRTGFDAINDLYPARVLAGTPITPDHNMKIRQALLARANYLNGLVTVINSFR